MEGVRGEKRGGDEKRRGRERWSERGKEGRKGRREGETVRERERGGEGRGMAYSLFELIARQHSMVDDVGRESVATVL